MANGKKILETLNSKDLMNSQIIVILKWLPYEIVTTTFTKSLSNSYPFPTKKWSKILAKKSAKQPRKSFYSFANPMYLLFTVCLN